MPLHPEIPHQRDAEPTRRPEPPAVSVRFTGYAAGRLHGFEAGYRAAMDGLNRIPLEG